MATGCGDSLPHPGAVIAPHGKTTMSPQLFRRQIDDGAWAITIASVQQLQVARHYGFESAWCWPISWSGARAIRYVLEEIKRDPEFDFLLLCRFRRAGEQTGCRRPCGQPLDRPLQLILEGGFLGGRTGCRQLDQAMAVARAVKEATSHICRCAASAAMRACLRGRRQTEAEPAGDRFPRLFD